MRMMNVYMNIAYYSLKQQLKYKITILLNIVSSIVFITISYYIWSSVLLAKNQNAGALNATLSYVVALTILNKVIGNNSELDIGKKIVTGDIATDLVRPVNFFFQMLFTKLGVVAVRFLFSVLPLVFIALFIFNIRFTADFDAVLGFSISVCLSFLLVYIFDFLVALVSFFSTQVFGISLLKTTLIEILAGITIPLSFYPLTLRRLFIELPFRSMYCIPIEILTGLKLPQSHLNMFFHRYLSSNIACLILEQAVWILLLGMLTGRGWQRAKMRLSIQGG